MQKAGHQRRPAGTTLLNSPQERKGRVTSVTDRDFIAEMQQAVEAAIPEGDYVASVVAADLVDRLRVEDPELLAGWLHLKAPVILADVVARRSNSKRQTARVGAPRRAFAEAARSFTTDGDVRVLSPFAAEYVVDEANTRRAVANMTADDCRFVAAKYEDAARISKLEAAFHRAVAKKIGGRVVGEVFTEEQYLEMYRSVTQQGPRAVPRAAA
ncbi:predicted protein [Streptomyces viridosporus ATCC 14672]|uniref:Predicted protein n=1 Tax=Streptomyces viridosporus (strain ATCC 14672 / DSM 40746 / JCM 4963 / KCTC 9882 / NRRL B-12104 / FH 1290) TaxID=566461 RepID=D6A4L5_STRV1|nr:predicted protein [Streptomyces viridosporus ATCC 14672]